MAHVLIAGAGVGGLTAAIALAKVGISVTILERAEVLTEVGAGLQISPNAGRVLARLDLLQAVAAAATQPDAIRVRAARTGRTLSLMPLGGAQARWGAPFLVIHRASLQKILLSAVAAEPAIRLQLATTLAGFGVTGAGVVVTTKQGVLSRTMTGDALIGADGVRSVVRARLVGGADEPLETGRTAWRILLDADAVDPPFRTRETGLWLGGDAHLVHYPLDAGRRVNVVAVTRQAASDGAGDETWSRPGDPEAINSAFSRWHPSARRLVASAGSWTTWPLFDRAPLPAWNAGPVALLGDAAHPILPFFAQGAAQAIEDAGALAGAVAATRSLPDALASYSGSRRTRTAKVQEVSRQLGRIYHLAGPAAVARDAGMRMLGPERLLARYDWLYGGRDQQT